MRQAILNRLKADYDFTAALPGGLYGDVSEISRQGTPAAFNSNNELLPCALLKISGNAPVSPYTYGARVSFELYFYQRDGYDDIETARERAFTLLHYQKLTPVGSTAGCWEIHHTGDVAQQEDEALRCCLEVSRFEAIVRRR
jgi:hypothetical protein